MCKNSLSFNSRCTLSDKKLNDTFMLSRETEISKTLVGFYVLLAIQIVIEMILTFSQWVLYKKNQWWVIVDLISEVLLLSIFIALACKYKSQKSSVS